MTDQAAPKYTGEKIDIFCHIMPPKYKEALFRKAGKDSYYIGNTNPVAGIN